MNQAVKEIWVDALRSGDYKQGKHALHNNSEDKYCCLGVLCDLYGREKGYKKNWKNNGEFNRSHDADYLPIRVMKWAGLNTTLPRVSIKGEPKSLATLNDGSGYGFKRIAHIIERDL